MNKYLLYPGCSMESSAKAYMESLNTILEPLEIYFEEIDDWNCCGATEYLGINLIPAYSLIARNLALAAKQMNGTRTVVDMGVTVPPLKQTVKTDCLKARFYSRSGDRLPTLRRSPCAREAHRGPQTRGGRHQCDRPCRRPSRPPTGYWREVIHWSAWWPLPHRSRGRLASWNP